MNAPAAENNDAFPFFKGATRAATVWGVPMIPLIAMGMGVAVIALLFGLRWWALAPVLSAAMAGITRHDDQAFRVWRLAIETKLRNRNKRLWGASSYAPGNYRRGRA
jgi:type IV secretion system protein VirB3